MLINEWCKKDYSFRVKKVPIVKTAHAKKKDCVMNWGNVIQLDFHCAFIANLFIVIIKLMEQQIRFEINSLSSRHVHIHVSVSGRDIMMNQKNH